jgi:protein O-GlcNAc transferase
VKKIPIQELFDSAVSHHQAERLQVAEKLYLQVLARKPNLPDALHLLGVVYGQTGRPQEGIDLVNRAIALNPKKGSFYFNLGLIHKKTGQKEEALKAFQRAAALKPQDHDAYFELGNALAKLDRFEEAAASFQTALAHKPESAEAWSELTAALRALNRAPDAIVALQHFLKLHPDDAAKRNDLGNLLLSAGRLEESIVCYRRALELKPGMEAAICNLGGALAAVHQLDEAISLLSTLPNLADAVYNLGNAHRHTGDFDLAIATFRRAIELRPDFPMAHNNLATALKDSGKIDEALAAYQTGVDLNPDYAVLRASRIFTLHFSPKYDSQAILQEHLKWNQIHAQPLSSEFQPHLNDRSPDRKLKIGYVSPDFCQHCQSFFTIPLLSNHDHSQFEVICYASVRRPDSYTGRIRGYADVWRNTTGFSDAQVAQLIRDDQIDILVDLAMHMSYNRLLTMARKPAPVSITWLAYPSTTGLPSIDYRLTDPFIDPPGQGDENYAEKSIRLPHTFWCYDPLTTEPQVNNLPALSSGQITFGCLNNYCKVHDQVLHLWQQVLQAVPNSKMLLLTPRGQHREHILQFFDPDRITFIEFLPRAQYLKTYHQIDIGLDTFPYNGHTTSLDSLWMGVPVISLAGNTSVSRAGFSQCSNLGLVDQLVATTPEQFVEKAKSLANDIPTLANLRKSLRQRLQQSPLMNAPQFTKDMESTYRTLWQNWCNR